MKKAIIMALVVFFCIPFVQSQKGYTVVDTGQNTCYNNSGKIFCPRPGEPFYGQDAQYHGVQPAYIDNNDGTITDLNTGLMWQKAPGDKVTYSEAAARAKTLTLGGYNDWRLPSIKELYSLILFSGTDPSGPDVSTLNPFIDIQYFDFEYGDTHTERIIDAQYWSSTEYVSFTMNRDATVFGVNFADGRIKGYPRDTGPGEQPMRQFVRYVRGNPDYGINNFVDNGDGTITDRATGLMWMKNDSGMGMDWEDALACIKQKNEQNYLNYTDWRLPHAKELQSIVDYTRSPSTTNSAAIDPIFNSTSITDESGKKNYPFFWSSTTHVSANGSGVFAVYIAFGEALGYMRTLTGNYELMDVHGAGAQRSDPKSGDPDDWPHGNGPQGDVVRIYNYVRCVRDVSQSSEIRPPETQPPETQPSTTQLPQTKPPSEPITQPPEHSEQSGRDKNNEEISTLLNPLYIIILALIVIIILLLVLLRKPG
ncbi:MAG: DUF1566 domain-containing protein [Candidatus Methanofastidiosia archaeon]